MNNITQVSQITYQDVADYIRLSEVTEKDQNDINTMLGVAKTYIQKYTGQEDLDQFQDFVIVVLVLVQDMWDNRALYVDSSNLNKVVESILDMHSINLLPSSETTS